MVIAVSNHARPLPKNQASKAESMIPDGFATVNPYVGNVRRNHAIAFACIDNETRSLSLMSAPRVNSGTASQSPVLLRP
jgi:hypothetical protein